MASSNADSNARSLSAGAQALFLIGFATLVPELVWARQLGEVFGSDLEGISITLGVFLLGSAAGLARSMQTDWSPRIWMTLALVCGVGVAFWCRNLVPAVTDGWFVAQSIPLRLLLAAPVAVYAFFLTGAIAPWFRDHVEPVDVASRTGSWIAAWDLGSAVAAVGTPLFLLPWFGPDGALFGAFVGLGIAIFLRTPGASSESQLPPQSPPPPVRQALAFTIGVVSFGLQVVWTRLLGEVLGTSLLVLGFAAAGLLLGGALGSRLAPVVMRRGSASRWLLVSWLGWLAAQTVSLLWMGRLPETYLQLVQGLDPEASVTSLKMILAWCALLPPAICSGLLLPLLTAGWSENEEQLARETGRIQSLGLLGGTVGAVATGLAVIPFWGSQNALWALAGLTAVGAVGTAATLAGWRSLLAPPAALALVVACLGAWGGKNWWDDALLGAGVFQWSRTDVASGQALADWRAREVLYSGEGRLARVTIERSPELNTSFLRVGGRVEGTVPVDPKAPSIAHLPTAMLLGLLPTLIGDEGREALVVGVGGGTTVATLVESDPRGKVTALEVEAEVLAALRSAAGQEAFPWEHERLYGGARPPELVVADARAYLHGQARTWDTIVCQPSEPWLPWSAPLFTQRFFELVRDRLAPGGFSLHWVQLYRIGAPELAGILAAFREVFPEVWIFHPPDTGEIILVGRPPAVARDTWDQRWDLAGVKACRERLRWVGPAPEPLLDAPGIDRWLQGRRQLAGSLRDHLEYQLPLLQDRGRNQAGELLRSLREAAVR